MKNGTNVNHLDMKIKKLKNPFLTIVEKL